MDGKVTNVKEEKKTQFRWSKQMSRSLLQFLAEEVQKGNRPNNTFRSSSLTSAAKHFSEEFRVQCTPDHVDNHLKTVRSSWGIISTVRGNFGFGWDDSLKMITASPNACSAYVEKNPAHERFLNKKIDMYEEMSIVVGKDMARGSFAKSFDDIDIEHGGSSLDAKGLKADSGGGEISSEARGRKRSRVDDEVSEMKQMTMTIGEVANALHKFSANQLDIDKLYEEMMKMKMEGFEEDFLSSAFDHLFEKEKLGKAFLVKSVALRKLWLNNFMNGKV